MAQLTHACPFCGGNLVFSQNDDIVRCKYCHKEISIKELSKDLFANKFQEKLNEAIELRNACDFEQAAIILEDVISQDKENAQAYYQLLLCEYGISFVDEDGNATREVPILNLVHEESIFDKHYYKVLCDLLKGNEAALDYYNASLSQIDKLRKDALDLMKEEEPYDVFISYKRQDNGVPTNDSEVARRLYDKFSSWGLKCFLAQKTLHEERFGEAFEPIIYSALMSAKIFILVCASPEKEYLNSPWVKSEWMRFKKRVETSKEKLLLIPVLEGGFKVDRIPTALKKFEALPLNEEFYQITNARFKNIIRVEKRSQFQNITLDTSIKKLKTTAENISTQSFKGFKETDLDFSEQSEFDIAVSEMEVKTKQSFVKAYNRLSKITETNPHNFNANLAKLKCDFCLHWKSPLNLGTIDKDSNIDRIYQDFYNTMVVASYEEAMSISNDMTSILRNLSTSILVNKILLDKNDLFLSVISSFKNKNLMLDAVRSFEGPFIEKVEKRFIKDPGAPTDSEIETILLKVFKRFYSNFEDEGARSIINLYNRVARKYINGKFFKFASKLNKVVLSIDEFNKEAIWNEFIIRCGGLDDIFELSNHLKDSNFRKFDLNNIPQIQGNEDNVYYVIVKLISGGARFNLASNSSRLSILFNTSLVMVNNPKKINLARNIIQTLIEMSGSAKISHEDYLQLLISSGNRFLIEEDYKEASKYFNEILANDEDNLDARWGLTKCEASCPTNYSMLFYKGSIGDLSSFKVLLNKYYALKEKEGNSQPENAYLKYYTAINNIKSGKQYKRIAASFKERNKELLDSDLPIDDSIDTILINLSSGAYLSENKGKKTESVSGKKKSGSILKNSSLDTFGKVGQVLIIIYATLIVLGIPVIVLLFEAIWAFLIVTGLFGLLVLINRIVLKNLSYQYNKLLKIFANLINYVAPITFIIAFIFGAFVFNETFYFGNGSYLLFVIMSFIGFIGGSIWQIIASSIRGRNVHTINELLLLEGYAIVNQLLGMGLFKIAEVYFDSVSNFNFIFPGPLIVGVICIAICVEGPILSSIFLFAKKKRGK